MSVHEQIVENLPLYALGELEGEERLSLEQHLEGCADCRKELEQMRGGLAMLAFSVSGPEPPLRSRERLMNAIAKEPRRAPSAATARRTSWWRVFELLVAGTAALIILLSARQNTILRQQVAALRANSTAQQQQLLEANDLIGALTSSEAEHFTLVAAKTPPQPQGKAIYIRRNGTLVFLASNMAPLPSSKIYELWLIPKSGAPIPAGLFTPAADGSATVIKPQLPRGVEAKTFAITVEPLAGSPSPTSQPIMVAATS
jgi:anti-sigma-K factor RskA